MRTGEAEVRPSSTTTHWPAHSIFAWYHEPGRSLGATFLATTIRRSAAHARTRNNDRQRRTTATSSWDGANTNTIEYPGPITADVDGTAIHGSGGIELSLQRRGHASVLHCWDLARWRGCHLFQEHRVCLYLWRHRLNGLGADIWEYSFGYGVYEGLLVAPPPLWVLSLGYWTTAAAAHPARHPPLHRSPRRRPVGGRASVYARPRWPPATDGCAACAPCPSAPSMSPGCSPTPRWRRPTTG